MARYTFTNDNEFDNTHIDYSFEAETIHEVFDHMKYFLRACGYEAAGDIGIFPDVTGEYDENEEKDFGFDNIPNNSWPFGDASATQSPVSMPKHSEHEHGWYNWDIKPIQPLTSADLTSLTVTDLSTLTTKSWTEWSGVNQYPTMAPLTTEQIQSWSMEMPGTLGSAKVKF